LKYTRPEGKVVVRASTRQDHIVFEVIDNGIGISPLDQPRLFEKFYRGAHMTPGAPHRTRQVLALLQSKIPMVPDWA